jgi:putative transcriptional regulator
MTTDLNPGDLLVAPPTIVDSRFEKTVLMLTHSTEAGSLAICLNKATDHKINDVLKEINIQLENNIPLYWGGPVSNSTIWMLHSKDWQIETTMDVNEHWSMTSHVSMFHHLADGDYPNKYRVFFGQSSWGPGQLRGELEGDPPWSKNHSWLVVKQPDPNWMFTTNTKNLWIESTTLCGEQTVESWLA